MSRRKTPLVRIVLTCVFLSLTGTARGEWTLIRGDCNGDLSLDISDPVRLLLELFGGEAPGPCADACDANDDGALTIADPIFMLAAQFAGGPPPLAPYPTCGADPTADTLGCTGPFSGCPESNQPPAITSAPPSEAMVGYLYLYPVVADDPGDTLAYELVASPAGAAIEAATGRITWTPAAGQLGSHPFTVRVTDDRGVPGSVEQSFSVSVLAAVLPDPLLEPPVQSPAHPCRTSACPACKDPEHPGNSLHSTHLFSGEFTLEAVDLAITGRGPDFIWTRRYRSRIDIGSALGPQWDFSYNISIEPIGPILRLHDGGGRIDILEPRADGTFDGDQFFRSGRFLPDGTFLLTFAHGGTWSFDPLGAGSTAGKIRSIADRYGNSLDMVYDGAGRLIQVVDTLDREIDIAYDVAGHLVSVTDFTGRTVTYSHYDGLEPGGGIGDLKLITTPAVTGTPNGNDFPLGKTTTYTYSTGFGGSALDHNLLTISDPSGVGILSNSYATTTTATDLLFDRLVRQAWGGPGDLLDVHTVTVAPTVSNRFAVVQAIVNDRVGNVSEHCFDAGNRPVIVREFTGRADPDFPTTDVDNRPSGKFRIDDPDFFETRYGWNADSLPIEVFHPNGNTTQRSYEVDLAPAAARAARGNLRELRRLPGTHTPVGDQSELVELFTYEPLFQLLAVHTDARGNDTTRTYDAQGSLLEIEHRLPGIVENFEVDALGELTAHIHPDDGTGHRRRDETVYFATGPARGYVELEIVDAENLPLTTTYEVDAVGNRTRVIDPNGHDTLFTFNSLEQVVRELSPVITPGGVRYAKDYSYDANDRLVQVDVENRDHTTAVQPNSHFTTTYTYESLGEQTSETREVDELTSVVTEFGVDANRNRTLTRYGAATSGAQPANVLSITYDERDRPIYEVRGEGSPDASTTRYDYDPNGNRVRTVEGLEGTPRTTEVQFDAFDRPLVETDPMGNVRTAGYDPNGNVVSARVDGEWTDVVGSALNIRLTETLTTIDAMDRKIREDRLWFDPVTQTNFDDGISRREFVFAPNSQLLRVRDDNVHEVETMYDTASRPTLVIDPKGNEVLTAYDLAGNVVSVTSTEKSDLGAPDQVFVTTFLYDELDRRITETDSAGSVLDFRYDSRGHLMIEMDARRVSPWDPGNVTLHHYDGLGRRTTTTHVMTADGTGTGLPLGTATTSLLWDASSRLVAQIDPNGNTISYAYDPLDRPTATTHADGTVHFVQYDPHDNVVFRVDANGNQIAIDHDLLDRPVTLTVLFAAPTTCGPQGPETYEYDGLSRLTRGADTDTIVTLRYDSLSNIVEETQKIIPGPPVRVITGTFDGVGNRTSLTYPGGLVIDSTYDELDRKKTILEFFAVLAEYHYVGPDRFERRTLSNGTQLDLAYDGMSGVAAPAGDFGVKKVISSVHSRVSGGTIIDERSYRWDRMGNKTERRDLRATGPGLTHAHEYDSLHRLVHTTATDPTLAVVRDVTYTLDGAGNRSALAGPPEAGSYSMLPLLPGPADYQANQYSTTPLDARIYDANGNLTMISGSTGRSIAYDHRNQMCEVFDLFTGVTSRYRYDVFGRRVEKALTGGGPSSTALYFYSGWQVCEEQRATGTTEATTIYGNEIDEALIRTEYSPGPVAYFYHADDLGSVVAVSDVTGAVLERVEYRDYGVALFSDANDLPAPSSLIDNPVLFTGRRLDAETGYYDYRTRYLDPAVGRFMTRDVIGIWGDPYNLGNGTAYLNNNPTSRTDPYGLGWFKKAKKRLQKAVRSVERSVRKTVRDASKMLAKAESRTRNAAKKFESKTRSNVKRAAAQGKETFREKWTNTLASWNRARESLQHLGNVGEKLIRVWKEAFEAGIRGAIIGAATGVFGGPGGIAAGFTAGFIQGATAGAQNAAMREFLGYERDTGGYWNLLFLL